MDAFDNVGETCVSLQGVKRSYIDPDNFTPTGRRVIPHTTSLATETRKALKAFFDAKGHCPSEAMWTALTELASVLEAMAEGRCPPKLFLSSLDPGVGKTQTVTHFLKALTSSIDHLDTGVLICVSRLDEIDRFVAEMELSRIAYAVLTSDPERNKLGIGSARSNKARVLFTTQQMIERRGAGRNFAEMRDFQFFARPRQVRIWDETIMPGQTVTLNRDDMNLLPRALRLTHPALARAIETFGVELYSVEDGTTYQVPDFTALASEKRGECCNKNPTSFPSLLSLNEALGLVAGGQPQSCFSKPLRLFGSSQVRRSRCVATALTGTRCWITARRFPRAWRRWWSWMPRDGFAPPIANGGRTAAG
jgi:hypothetical protein